MENPYEPPPSSDFSDVYQKGYGDGFNRGREIATLLETGPCILCHVIGAAGCFAGMYISGSIQQRRESEAIWIFLFVAFAVPVFVLALIALALWARLTRK